METCRVRYNVVKVRVELSRPYSQVDRIETRYKLFDNKNGYLSFVSYMSQEVANKRAALANRGIYGVT